MYVAQLTCLTCTFEDLCQIVQQSFRQHNGLYKASLPTRNQHTDIYSPRRLRSNIQDMNRIIM